jgi:hypothetical protein
MDSGGKAERSSAWSFFGDFGRLAAGFGAADFFQPVVFENVTPALERGAALFVCLRTGLVFRRGIICLFQI